MPPGPAPTKQSALRALPAVLAAALAALLCASGLAAQDVPFPGQIFGGGQPPVTEADVPAGLELLAAIHADSERSELTAIGKRHGMDEARTVYVYTKFAAAYLLLEPGSLPEETVAESLGSRNFLPTPAELDVMRAHAAEIHAALRD
ncbi:MAG: hypothetical protein LBT40_08110 [Deltaproteobacteria bacterium]|jgi:hypothetical protein|nr:hypothetical protein [Deltaproteobacteria bacterium]